ncbi:hypothetical protein DFP72DRAFT_1041496 [Ephemerocybe angulata]|uniref:C2H2-type domain-containing protein n=1 Tax=Ephemerocybe angulata TaxID=980116 RepID=A0A8H6IAQ0_9AGAR|nr:hypothetical protein DFP72DRAFT_1041496 [Tulosesus angulatus]
MSDGVEQRLLALQEKIREGERAKREWEELQRSLQASTSNTNPQNNAQASSSVQPVQQQHSGPSHLPQSNTTANVQGQPGAYAVTNVTPESGQKRSYYRQRPAQTPQSYSGKLSITNGQGTATYNHRPRGQQPPNPFNQYAIQNQAAGSGQVTANFTNLLQEQAAQLSRGYAQNHNTVYAPPLAQVNPPPRFLPGPAPQLPGPQSQHPQQQVVRQPQIPHGVVSPPLPPQPPIRQPQPSYPVQRPPSVAQEPHLNPSSGSVPVRNGDQQPQQPSYGQSSAAVPVQIQIPPAPRRSPQPNIVQTSAPQPATQPTGPPPAQQQSTAGQRRKERVVDVPAWPASKIKWFQENLESFAKTAAVGTTVDMFTTFQFAKGFVLQKQYDGVWLVDTGDNMKAACTALVETLIKRHVPDVVVRPSAQVAPPSAPIESTASIPPIPSGSTIPARHPVAPSSAIPSTSTSTSHVPAPDQQTSVLPRVSTPQGDANAKPNPAAVMRSPANANKKTLAKDILLALGKRPLPPSNGIVDPPAKRVAIPSLVGPPLNRTNHTLSGSTSYAQIVDYNAPAVGATVNTGVPGTHMFKVNVGRPGIPPTTVIHNGPTTPATSSIATTSSVASSLADAINAAHAGPSTKPPAAATPAPPAPEATIAKTTSPTALPPVNSPPSLPRYYRAHVLDSIHQSPVLQPAPTRVVTPSQPVASSSKLVAKPNLPPREVSRNSPSVPPIVTIDSSHTSTTVQSAKSSSASGSDVTLPPPSSKTGEQALLTSSPGDARMFIDLTMSPSPSTKPPNSSVRSETEEPLFLPSDSPPPSPQLGRLNIASRSGTSSRAGSRKGKQRAYVLIPPPSPRTLKFMRGERSKTVSRAPTISRRSSSRGATSEEEEAAEYDYSFDAQGSKIDDPVERTLMETACTRIQSLECKWDGCDAIMNSVIAVIKHLKKVHRPEVKSGTGKSFSCRWKQCGKQCSFNDSRHFLKHATDYLSCPHIDCEDRFRTVGQLRRHVDKHAVGSPLKPSCKLFRPTLAPPPEPPATLPSYMVISRQVRQASVPRARPRESLSLAGLAKSGQPTPGRRRGNRALGPKDKGVDGIGETGLISQEDILDHPIRYTTNISGPTTVKVADLWDTEGPFGEVQARKGICLVQEPEDSDGDDELDEIEDDDGEEGSHQGKDLENPDPVEEDARRSGDEGEDFEDGGRKTDQEDSDPEEVAQMLL